MDKFSPFSSFLLLKLWQNSRQSCHQLRYSDKIKAKLSPFLREVLILGNEAVGKRARVHLDSVTAKQEVKSVLIHFRGSDFQLKMLFKKRASQ